MKEKAYINHIGQMVNPLEACDWLYNYAKRKFKNTVQLDIEQTKQCVEAFRKRYEIEYTHQSESYIKGLAYGECAKKYIVSLDTIFGMYNLTIERKNALNGIDEEFADKLNQFVLNKYSFHNRYEYFSCGYPNEILEACGLNKDFEIVITTDGMRKMLGKKNGKKDDAHNLTEIEILRIPQLIREPILIINGNTSDSRLVFIEIPRAGRKMFAVIGLDRDLSFGKHKKYNLIASVYSQENFKIEEKIKAAIATNNIWYCNTDKTKNWLSEAGKLQLLTSITINSLYSEIDFLNANIEKDSENQTDSQENLGSYVSNFVNDLKKANEKLKNAQKKQKLNLLKDFFRGRKKVRINSNPPEIGKSPIHAYSYPTGTMYADVRFEQFSEGNGWDYLKVCFVFNDPNYSGGITVYCDALPEYKEFVKTKKSFIDGTPTLSFSKHLSELYSKGEKLDWLKAKKIAKDFNIETETEIMQACELAVVLTAREIAQNGNSIRQQYEEMKDLYERQVTIRPLDTKSRVFQQYSTPCPLGYLLGRFVNKNNRFWNGKILEPSAGNGLLTIAFPPQQVCVNELDEIRVANLKNLGFSSVTNQNASSDLDLAIFPDKSFRGVITNPPFAKLTEKDKIERHGWQINTLDYKMAVLALDKMHNDGKAAVIVGGKLWNAYWKPLSERSEKKVLFGQWKTFLGYLYAQYNVVDVVYIDGDHIYQKQGTSYPIVVILIDGRHDYDEANKPRYVFDPNQDTIINTFDQLFDRINPFLEAKVQDEDSERKRKLLILAQAKIRIAKAKNNN